MGRRKFDIKRFQFKGWTLVIGDNNGRASTEFKSGDDAVSAWLKAKKRKGVYFATLWGHTTTGHQQMLKDYTV